MGYQYDRRASAQTENEQRFGRYNISWLPQHAEVIPRLVDILQDAERKYQAKGIAFKDEFNVVVSGKPLTGRHSNGAALYVPSEPPKIQVLPKAFRGPGTRQVVVHEFGHYVHDKLVPEGFYNPEIEARFAWAVKQAPKKNDDYLSRYELAAHEWIPSSYARTNEREWFAEMITSFVLGHLKDEPSAWLMSVIRTGEAP